MQTIQLNPTSFVDFHPNFLSQADADSLYTHLTNDIDWRKSMVKERELPRLQCWMSDPGVVAQLYQKEPAMTWSPEVTALKNKLEELLKFKFNYVLMNKYRDGKDRIGFHRDDEAETPETNVIASISLGATRTFIVKNKKSRKSNNSSPREFKLNHGSLIVMRGDMQINWLHGIPEEPDVTEPRINLTFRHS